MTNLATLGSAHGRSLTRGKRWHVVMVHVSFSAFGVESVQLLSVARRAQGRKAQHLSHAALEQAGAMHTRNYTDFRREFAYLGWSTPIRTDAVLNDPAPDFGSHNVVIALFDAAGAKDFFPFGGFGIRIFRQYNVTQIVKLCLAFIVIRIGRHDVHDLALDAGAEFFGEFGKTLGWDIRGFGLAELLTHFTLDTDYVLHRVMGKTQSFDHRRLVHFCGSGFDHDYRIFGASHT